MLFHLKVVMIMATFKVFIIGVTVKNQHQANLCSQNIAK